MIKCWDKDGRIINLKDNFNDGDSDMSEVTEQLIPLMAFLSQKAKTIITKVKIEDNDIILTIEQK